MIHTYLIKFKNQIRFNEIPLFRGAVINALPSDSSVLFHNHTQESGFVYRYPYIQYKRINGKAAIFCISDGIDAISEFFQNKPQTLNLGDNQITTDIESISPRQLLLQTWNQEFYYHLRKWVALNSENYKQYLEIESLTDRITFLERILIGNLLSFAKGFIEVENQGEEEIFLSLMLSRTPSANENIEPAATGVEIDVQYTDLSGKAISVEKLRQGEEFYAKIRVRKVAEDSQSMALTYAVPSGWEIWNERLVGGKDASQADYTDIRDTQISWYFALEQGKRQEFIVRMRAAYEGSFILPPAICEDMYKPSCRANTSNSSVIVER